MARQRMKLRNREPHLLVRVGSATNRDPPRAPSCLPLTSVHRPITLTAVGLKRGDHWLFTQVSSVIISCPEKLVSDTSILTVGACETSGQHGRCDPHASLCNVKSPDESRSLSGQPTETERREIIMIIPFIFQRLASCCSLGHQAADSSRRSDATRYLTCIITQNTATAHLHVEEVCTRSDWSCRHECFHAST